SFRSLTGSEKRDDGEYEEDRAHYADELERGRVLVVVRAPDEQSADRAAGLLRNHGAENVSESASARPATATTIGTSAAGATAETPVRASAPNADPAMAA